MTGLLTIEQAQAAVLARVRPLAGERVALDRAAGRVLVEPARALVDLPPFASSAMDGFAVRAGDVPATLPVVAAIAAGVPADRPLRRGEAMAIATGAAVPDEADAVVPLEAVARRENEVTVRDPVSPGANVRPRGGDVRAGDVVVPAGERLRPSHLGALAAAGATTATCARRPRAVVLTTGSELREPGRTLSPGEIYEANGTMLAAALAAAGAEVERLPAIGDDEDAHREAIGRGLAADVLVTSGGVSVGPHDLVRGVAAELGVEEVFWGVAVKPGKPVAFGVRGGTLVFGLPGNPVSSLVGLQLLVLPAVLALQRAARALPAFVPGRLATAVRRSPVRDELVRARALAGEDGVLLEPLSGQESHMIARAAAADALVRIPTGEGELPEGAVVRYVALA